MKKFLSILLSALMLLSCAAFAEDSGRVPAEYSFELYREDKYIENLIFNENVVISGDGSANIFFINCQFNADVINTSDAATRVFLLGSEINGNCIFRNTVTETTIDAPFPKFLTDSSVNVLTEDCFGIAIAMGDFPITFNGEAYDLAGSEFFSMPKAIPFPSTARTPIFSGWPPGPKTAKPRSCIPANLIPPCKYSRNAQNRPVKSFTGRFSSL